MLIEGKPVTREADGQRRDLQASYTNPLASQVRRRGYIHVDFSISLPLQDTSGDVWYLMRRPANGDQAQGDSLKGRKIPEAAKRKSTATKQCFG